MSLYSSSVKRPVTTILIFVAVVILGLFSLQKLPIDLYPDIDTNYHGYDQLLGSKCRRY